MTRDAAEMQRLLAHANYRKVGDALSVSRATVSEWARGNDVSPYRVRQVRELLRKDLGTQRNAPTPLGPEQPEWAAEMERLWNLLVLVAIESGVPLDRVEAMQRELPAGQRSPLPDEAHHLEGLHSQDERAGSER